MCRFGIEREQQRAGKRVEKFVRHKRPELNRGSTVVYRNQTHYFTLALRQFLIINDLRPIPPIYPA